MSSRYSHRRWTTIVTRLLLAALFFCNFNCGRALELRNGAYDELVVSIDETVPTAQCQTILQNLEAAITSASHYLFSALDSRAFLRSATVLLPPSWPDSCAPKGVGAGSGQHSDLTVLPRDPVHHAKIHTQQSLGCGQPGDQIFVTHESLLEHDPILGRLLVKELAKYRYGVFDEIGYENDPVYPLCFFDEHNHGHVTGCSDLPIRTHTCGASGGAHGVLSSTAATTNAASHFNESNMEPHKARTSIMFSPETPSVSMFCDDGNHNRFAPTKHNSICNRRSVLDVILKHPDFRQSASIPMADNESADKTHHLSSKQLITDTTPKFLYRRQNLTRYVFVIENTKEMMLRESWSYLRLAMRQWALNILPDNTEVGMVLADDATGATSAKILNIVAINNYHKMGDRFGGRDNFYSTIPYTAGESNRATSNAATVCLHCALRKANEMLTERTRSHGAAHNVIVVIAAGLDRSQQLDKTLDEIRKSRVRIASINYPTLARSELLNHLADRTGGIAFSVFERKLNVDTSLLSTYFELQNVLRHLVKHFYAGSIADLPIEIHRRQLRDDGRTSVTGTFMLEPHMGEPARFTFFTHNTVTPLIRSLKLVSPSHQVFTHRNDRFIDFKMIMLNSNMSESGTWTYTVEPYPGNPQPHYLQVTATPVSYEVPVLRARFWIQRPSQHGSGGTSIDHSEPLIMLCELSRGHVAVLGAKVVVEIQRISVNGSQASKVRQFELLDTGSGDPDITKGDGVYTRYFSVEAFDDDVLEKPETTPLTNGSGGGSSHSTTVTEHVYTFEVTATDNGNTAYTWSQIPTTEDEDKNKACCGSMIQGSGATPMPPFQRIMPKLTLMLQHRSSNNNNNRFDFLNPSTTPDSGTGAIMTYGKIADLRAQIVASETKARLSWTSPDMGGRTVSHYEVKFASTLADILDRFETGMATNTWDLGQPFPLSAGHETTFTLDFSDSPHLFGKPMYFAIKAHAKGGDSGAIVSNWVRVVIPPPPTPSSTISPDGRFHGSGGFDRFWPRHGNGASGIYRNSDEDSGVGGVGVDPLGPSLAKSMHIGLELILPIAIGFTLLVIILMLYCYFCVMKRKGDRRHGGMMGGHGDDGGSVDKHGNCNGGTPDKFGAPATITIVSPTNGIMDQSQQHYMHHHHQLGLPLGHAPQYETDDDSDLKKQRYSLVHQQEQQLIEELKQQQQQQQLYVSSGLSIISNGGVPTTNSSHTLSPYTSWTASQLLHEHERRYSPMDGVGGDMIMGGQHMGPPPPVPPLPGGENGSDGSPDHHHHHLYSTNTGSSAYSIYGMHQPPPIYQSMPRNGGIGEAVMNGAVTVTPSLQGSMSSVNSGEKKRRNVTMV